MNESSQASVDDLQIRTDTPILQNEVSISDLDPTFNDPDISTGSGTRPKGGSKPQEVSRLSEQERLLIAKAEQAQQQTQQQAAPVNIQDGGYVRPTGRSNQDAIDRALNMVPKPRATNELDLDNISQNMSSRKLTPAEVEDQQIAASIKVDFNATDDTEDDLQEEPQEVISAAPVQAQTVRPARAPQRIKQSIKITKETPQEKTWVLEKDPSDTLTDLFEEPPAPIPEVYTKAELEELRDILPEDVYISEMAKIIAAEEEQHLEQQAPEQPQAEPVKEFLQHVDEAQAELASEQDRTPVETPKAEVTTIDPVAGEVEVIDPPVTEYQVPTKVTPNKPTIVISSTPNPNESNLYTHVVEQQKQFEAAHPPKEWPTVLEGEFVDLDNEVSPREVILKGLNGKLMENILVCVTDRDGKPVEELSLDKFTLAMEVAHAVYKQPASIGSGKMLFNSISEQDLIAKLSRNLVALFPEYKIKNIPFVHIHDPRSPNGIKSNSVVDVGTLYYNGDKREAYRAFYVPLFEEAKSEKPPLCIVLIEVTNTAIPLDQPRALWIQ